MSAGVDVGGDVGAAHVEQPGQCRLHEGDLDMLAEAGLAPFFDGGEDADGGVEAGELVDHGRADLGGFAVDLAGDVHEAAHGLDEEVVSGQVASGTGTAEAGDRAGDDRRLLGGQRLTVEAEAAHRARSEVVDHDIGAQDNASGHREVVRPAQVEGDGLLVAVEGQEVGAGRAVAVVPPRRAPRAGVVSDPGLFDLDDIGA